MTLKQYAILSVENDLHAIAIQAALHDRFGVDCHFVQTDRLCGSSGLCWSSSNTYAPTLLTASGHPVDVRALDLIWWRRANQIQIPRDIHDPAQVDLITNDCRQALVGLLMNEYGGVWISDPQATRRAENKLVQLKAAKLAGLRVPKTLVSQSPQQIRHFCASLDQQVVVKAVKGTTKVPLLSVKLDNAMLTSDETLQLCPAIYQELIPGKYHVRASCFGDAVYSALIESERLDWRPNLDVPVSIIDLPKDINTRLRSVLKALGLRMGIFDLKFAEDREPVFLEVNAQGQFLFIEGLCGLKLTDAFCEFLCSAAEEGQRRIEQIVGGDLTFVKTGCSLQ
jgi:glutathione synthase/RimK-type ligase-like ATP-grasp enzyme